MPARRWFLALLAAFTILITACSDSSNDSGDDAPAADTHAEDGDDAPADGEDGAEPAAEEPADPAAAEAEITTVFVTFYDGSNPDLEAKLALIEDSTDLRDIFMESQEANADLAARTMAEITTITFTSATTADVMFSLLLDGEAVLEQLGEATIVDGAWLISRASYCDVAGLGNPEILDACLGEPA